MVTEIRPFQHNNGYISPHPKDKNKHFSNGVLFEESSALYSEHIWKHPNYKNTFHVVIWAASFLSQIQCNQQIWLTQMRILPFCAGLVNLLLQIVLLRGPLRTLLEDIQVKQRDSLIKELKKITNINLKLTLTRLEDTQQHTQLALDHCNKSQT